MVYLYLAKDFKLTKQFIPVILIENITKPPVMRQNLFCPFLHSGGYHKPSLFFTNDSTNTKSLPN